MNSTQPSASDFNKLLDDTQFKAIVGEILTTGRHLPQKMHSVIDGYFETQQSLLAETGRQWEAFIVRKHYPLLVSPPKSSSCTPAFKSEMKLCKDSIKEKLSLLMRMQRAVTELISISEEFGSICNVAGFDNQAFISAITVSRKTQLQAPVTFAASPHSVQQLSIATSPQPAHQLSLTSQMSGMSFADDYWSSDKIRDCGKSVRKARADLKLELADEEEDVHASDDENARFEQIAQELYRQEEEMKAEFHRLEEERGGYRTDEEPVSPVESDFHSICHRPIQKVEVVSDAPGDIDFEWRLCHRRCPFYEVDGPLFGGPNFTGHLYFETGPGNIGYVEAFDSAHLLEEHPIKLFRVNRQPDAPWTVKQLPNEFRLALRQSQQSVEVEKAGGDLLEIECCLERREHVVQLDPEMTRRICRWFKVWAGDAGEAGDVHESTSSSDDSDDD